MIAVYALFLIYPMAHLIQQSVIDGDTGQLTMANFSKFFSQSYYFNTLINSFKAVSYTHLDVYKRQVCGFAAVRPSGISVGADWAAVD